MALNHKRLAITFLIISFLGFLDATYLAVEHYRGVTPPCTIVAGCEKVTTSRYATIFGVPVALLGSIYYLTIFLLSVLVLERKKERFLFWVGYLSGIGFLAALWFLFLQVLVIRAICLYCVFSALTSTTLFVLGILVLKSKRDSGLDGPSTTNRILAP
ncbi:MAG: vitamin K epoxide reductase family protein [Candidatus Liptonbacteria bacterium]|nr:vitamin K epoxide reductase family protein [Candidatus Liptonbacteria bacterium]